jgi:hypothetical protein
MATQPNNPGEPHANMSSNGENVQMDNASSIDSDVIRLQERMIEENDVLRQRIEDLQQRLTEISILGGRQANLNYQTLLDTSGGGGKDPGEILKLGKPESYDGTPAKLKEFLTALKAYFLYFPRTLRDDNAKIQFAITRLTGTARTWFQPLLAKYVEGAADERTLTLFNNYELFERQLKQMFQPVNEDRKIRDDIKNLRQLGSAMNYAAKFKFLSAQAEWDNVYLREAFYDGLKDRVKDELSKVLNPPENIAQYMQLAVQIDEVLFQREQEKKGQRGQRYLSNQTKRRDPPSSTASGTHAGPMELGNYEPQRQERKDRKDIVCYNCNKKGHISRNCKAPRKQKKENGSMGPAKEVGVWEKEGTNHTARSGYETTKTGPEPTNDKHDVLHWTACYDDQCYVHQSGKMDNGWFPKECGVWEHGDEYCDLPEQESDDTSSDEDTEPITDEEWKKMMANNQNIEMPHHSLFPNGCRTNLRILAGTMKEAQEEQCFVPTGGRMDPRLQPNHEEHRDIAWTSCYVWNCDEHLKKKAEHKTFPLYTPGVVIPTAYEKSEVQGYRVSDCDRERQLTTITFSEQRSCFLGADEQHCRNHECTIHNERKIEQWHQRVEKKDFYRNPAQYQRHLMVLVLQVMPCDECRRHKQNKILPIMVWLMARGMNARNYATTYWQHEIQAHDNEKLTACDHETSTEDESEEEIATEEVNRQIDEIPVRRQQLRRHVRFTNQEDPRELCGIETPTRSPAGKLTLEVHIRGHRLNALLDSGAMDNFISEEVLQRCNIPWKQKQRPYSMVSLEGQQVNHNNGMVDRETDHLKCDLSGYRTLTTFDVMKIRSHDLILGFPWLQKNNPDVDWEKGQLRWRSTADSPDNTEMEETEFQPEQN